MVMSPAEQEGLRPSFLDHHPHVVGALILVWRYYVSSER
jgi:hypothetical protein